MSDETKPVRMTRSTRTHAHFFCYGDRTDDANPGEHCPATEMGDPRLVFPAAHKHRAEHPTHRVVVTTEGRSEWWPKLLRHPPETQEMR